METSDEQLDPCFALELIDISKQYPAVKANDRVSLRVAPGEIHAVLGENGAGKSTLMKIIYGAVRPDEGEIRWNGQPVKVREPAAGARARHQHGVPALRLFDTLTAAENVWLGLDKSLLARRGDAAHRARSRTSTASTSTRCARCTRCRSASGSASRSCARC